MLLDDEGRYRNANAQAAELLGVPVDDLLGRHFSEFTPPDNEDEGNWREALSTPTARGRSTIVRPDGSRRVVDYSATRAVVPGQHLAAMRDVTDRVRAAEKRELLTRVSREIGEADSFEDGLERVLEAICTFTDWRYAEAWLPDDRRSRLSFGAGHAVEPELESFLSASRPVTFEVGEGLPGRVYASGQPEWIADVSAEPESVFSRTALAEETGVRGAFGLPIEDDGEVVAVLAFFLYERRERDDRLVEDVIAVAENLGGLIALKQAEELVGRQNTLLDEFASVVSHDLRNPLSVAQGRLELARQETDSEDLAAVARAHDRMEGLIKSLLTLARQGERVGGREPVDLAAMATESWAAIDTPDATLRIESERTVYADSDRLQQLLENVFRNAVDHVGEGVQVRVGDLADGFYVEDDGPGVPNGVARRVFEPGYTTADDGFGLGLTIVQQVAEGHGWEVGFEGTDGGGRLTVRGVEEVRESPP